MKISPTVWLVIGLSCNAIDKIGTEYGYIHGVGEANPPFNFLITHFGIGAACIIAFLLTTVALLWIYDQCADPKHTKLSVFMLKFLSLALVATVIWNVSVMIHRGII